MISTTATNTNVAILFAFGTATISPLSIDVDYMDSYPITNIPYEQFDYDNNSYLENNDLSITIDQIQVMQKIDALKSFSISIIENSQSLDEETIEIINKNFWDWI